MFSVEKKASRSDSNFFRKLRVMIAIRSWVALAAAALSFSPVATAADTPSGKASIQSGNLRVEFDNSLRSRVVARLDKKETVLGPFTASETVMTADKPLTGFLLTSQKHERTKDRFGDGEQLIVEGKSGALTKKVTVTVYDD